MKVVQVFGVEDIAKKMRKNPKLERYFGSNMIRAGAFIQRESQKVVPVDTSNLKNSAGTKAQHSGFDVKVSVYYTASYAVYVHERVDLRHKSGKQAKFLEEPIKKNRGRILKIIAGGKK